MPAGPVTFAMVLSVSLLLIDIADVAQAQTFSYTRSWKPGKRATLGLGGLHGLGEEAPLAHRGGSADDSLAGYLQEVRAERRVPCDPWRFTDDQLARICISRRPVVPPSGPLGQNNDQDGEHDV